MIVTPPTLLKFYNEHDEQFPDSFKQYLVPQMIAQYAKDNDSMLLFQRYIAGTTSIARLNLSCSKAYRLQAKPGAPAFYLFLALDGSLMAGLDQSHLIDLPTGKCQMGWYAMNELLFLLPPAAYEVFQVRITADMINKLAEKFESMKWLLRYGGDLLEQPKNLVVNISQGMRSQCHTILKCLEREEKKEIERELGRLIAMYATALFDLVYPAAVYQSGDLKAKMTHYIRNHLHGPIPVEDMAVALSVSESTLQRDCEEQLHMPPGRFIMLKRLERAIEQLLQTQLSLEDIAFDTGFCHAAHFTKAFKENMGCTPSEYRKKHKGKKG
jgi:AraC-like DNA-binding protein